MRETFRKIIIGIITWQAKIVLKKYKPKILVVTGSMGKTSTKDTIFKVFSKYTHVRKSEKGFENEIGIPLTILGIASPAGNIVGWISVILHGIKIILLKSEYPDWLILELGARKPGEIKKISKWLYSNAVIVTRIGDTPSHIEFFSGKDHIVREKTTIFTTLRRDGIIFLNRDDENYEALKEKAKNKVVTFGSNDESEYKASNYIIDYDTVGFPSGSMYRIDNAHQSMPIKLNNCLGENYFYASLVAFAFCSSEGMNPVDIVEVLSTNDSLAGRMQIIDGIKNTKIIDDTYNSSPLAQSSALSLFAQVKSIGRKILIIGDMLELGKYTEESHKQIGKEIAKYKFDYCLLVGKRAKSIGEEAITMHMNNKHVMYFNTSEEAGKYCQNILKSGDIVLVKGSQLMRMERAVEEIMSQPENKNKLLVRQE